MGVVKGLDDANAFLQAGNPVALVQFRLDGHENSSCEQCENNRCDYRAERPGSQHNEFPSIIDTPDVRARWSANHLAARHAAAHSQLRPECKVEALPLDKNTPGLLESGDADLAFGGFVPHMEAGFYQQTLFDQEYVCLVSANHPRIANQLTLDDFQREAHVAFGCGRSFALIEAEMKHRNIERRVMVFLPGVLGVVKIVAATDMITALPGQTGTILANGGRDAVRIFPCPVPMPNVVVKQFWHSRFHHDPGNQWLRAICAEQARLGMLQISDGEIPEYQATLID